MGIKVLDEVPTPYGMGLAGLFYSCKGSYSVRKKDADSYEVSASFDVRVANDASIPPITFDQVSVMVSGVSLGSNLLSTVIYPALKTKFAATEDT